MTGHAARVLAEIEWPVRGRRTSVGKGWKEGTRAAVDGDRRLRRMKKAAKRTGEKDCRLSSAIGCMAALRFEGDL